MNVTKIAGYLPVSAEMMLEAREIRRWGDRCRNPWAYPDPPAVADIDPFPGLTRLQASWRTIRQRMADIAYVARYGMPEENQ